MTAASFSGQQLLKESTTDIVTDTVGDGQILGLRKAGFCPNGPLGHNPPDRVVGPQRSERGFFCQLSRTSYIRSVDDPLWCNPEWRQYMYARCKANGEKRCRSDRKERERILLPA